MRKKQSLLWMALLAVFALAAASCGGDDDSDGATTAPTTAAPATTAEPEETPAPTTMAEEEETPPATTMAEEMTEPAMDMEPGAGVSLTMARANWSTGYFQAYVFEQILEELGYDVSNPADKELGPSLAYLAMAQGEADFWVNSWYPGHNSWLRPDLPDGSTVGDHVGPVGALMPASGLEGYLISAAFADEFGVYTLDALNGNPDAIAAYDADDANPGNGLVDMYGCPESWTCDNILDSQIAFSGWENIVQVKAGYDAMLAEAVDKARNGEPMVAYTWAPSAYVAQLLPGANTYWIAVDDILDDSNPLDAEGGDEWDQRGDPNDECYPNCASANIPADSCPDAAVRGTCQLGRLAANILASSRFDVLEANPAFASILDSVKIPPLDVNLASLQQSTDELSEEGIQEQAAQWIADNRDLVDSWLDAARTAAMG